MNNFKRCPECMRPICQRRLTLRGCKEKAIEEMSGIPLNDYTMHNLFTTG